MSLYMYVQMYIVCMTCSYGKQHVAMYGKWILYIVYCTELDSPAKHSGRWLSLIPRPSITANMVEGLERGYQLGMCCGCVYMSS